MLRTLDKCLNVRHMTKITSVVAATFLSIFTVTLVAVLWSFLPALFFSAWEDYIYSQIRSFTLIVLAVAAIIVSIIGIPTYLLLDNYGKATQRNLALTGFLIPVVILLALMIIFSPSGDGSYSSGQNYYGTYRDMVVENERTFWGWVSTVEQYITYGIYGLVGAVTFGKVASLSHQPKNNA